jgi:ubiquinone/menaquinone biosynthesis C-methylase UbiE
LLPASVLNQTVLEAALYIKVLKALIVTNWRQKRSVMRRYDLTFQMYDERYSDEQKAKYRVALDELGSGKGSVALDLGCGSGLFFTQVAGNIDMVIGIDVSLNMLLIARERAKNFSGVFLVQADADHLPLRRNIFSHVFAFTMLQNMPEPVKTLQELKIVSKRDACFFLSGLKAVFSLEAFIDYLEEAGLHVVSVRNDDLLRCFIVKAVNRET